MSSNGEAAAVMTGISIGIAFILVFSSLFANSIHPALRNLLPSFAPDDTFSFGASWIVPNEAVTGTVYEARTFARNYVGNETEPLSTVLSNQIIIA